MSEKPEVSSPEGSGHEGLWHQLQNTVTLTAKQDQIVWAIFGVFCAAEAVLLAALFQSGGPPTGFVGPVVSTAGIVISVVWGFIQYRAIAWLKFYEEALIQLEELLRMPVRLTVPKKEPEKVKGFRVRPLMIGCPWVSAIIWFIVAIIWWYWSSTHVPVGK
jgi:hypothetical protein